MLVRSVVCALIMGLFFSVPAFEASAARQSSRLAQKLKDFFDMKDGHAFDMLRKLAVGTAIIAAIGGAAVVGGQKIIDFAEYRAAEQSTIMFDTILRFEDDILGRNFHYTVAGKHYEGKVSEWNYPYHKIKIYSSYYDRDIVVPVKDLLGKEIVEHNHEGAKVVFFNHEPKSSILHGKVLTVFDSGYYYVFAEARKSDDGTLAPLDQKRLLFVPQEDIYAIEPLPLY